MDEPTGRQILDALLGFRDAVSARFDEIPTRTEMNARFAPVDTRLDRVERRLTNLETRVDEGFAKLESRRRR